LASPPRRADVRPTSDRVREALFAILGAGVEGTRVLDLYCGTGALAIEALSRGALDATLVDRDTSLAARNVADLGLSERCELVRADALAFLRRERRQWDLIFCDPPYRLADRLKAPLESLVPARLAEGGRLVTESSTRRPLTLDLPISTERDYGDTHLGVHHA
jgi:16S rRNA (guanine966-N2)-methyltransferase